MPARCCDAATAGLTVRENVLLAVQLALPAATPLHVLDSTVGRVLRHLGLERVQNRMAVDGGLSRSQQQVRLACVFGVTPGRGAPSGAGAPARFQPANRGR